MTTNTAADTTVDKGFPFNINPNERIRIAIAENPINSDGTIAYTLHPMQDDQNIDQFVYELTVRGVNYGSVFSAIYGRVMKAIEALNKSTYLRGLYNITPKAVADLITMYDQWNQDDDGEFTVARCYKNFRHQTTDMILTEDTRALIGQVMVKNGINRNFVMSWYNYPETGCTSKLSLSQMGVHAGCGLTSNNIRITLPTELSALGVFTQHPEEIARICPNGVFDIYDAHDYNCTCNNLKNATAPRYLDGIDPVTSAVFMRYAMWCNLTVIDSAKWDLERLLLGARCACASKYEIHCYNKFLSSKGAHIGVCYL